MEDLHNIKVDRQSVCLGDDIEDHLMILQIDDSISVETYIYMLRENKFFARVDGDNIVWVLTINNMEVASYYAKSSEVEVMDEVYWEKNKLQHSHFFKCFALHEKKTV